jgi:hypothetical protein
VVEPVERHKLLLKPGLDRPLKWEPVLSAA